MRRSKENHPLRQMGPRSRNFNVLLLRNRGFILCAAYLQQTASKTNVRHDF